MVRSTRVFSLHGIPGTPLGLCTSTTAVPQHWTSTVSQHKPLSSKLFSMQHCVTSHRNGLRQTGNRRFLPCVLHILTYVRIHYMYDSELKETCPAFKFVSSVFCHSNRNMRSTVKGSFLLDLKRHQCVCKLSGRNVWRISHNVTKTD